MGSLVAALIEEVGRERLSGYKNMGYWLVGPESYRSKSWIIDAGSSQHGGAVLRPQLAIQQASTTLATAYYQPATNQIPQEDCLTPTHPHATISCQMYYIHMWHVFYFLIQVI